MASPLRNSNYGSGTSPVSAIHSPHQTKMVNICRAKLIPLEEKVFEVTDVTAAHLQDLQREGNLTSSQSHPDEDYRVHIVHETPAGTPTTAVISHRENDHPVEYSLLFSLNAVEHHI